MTWPPPLPCGCPSAASSIIDLERHDAYHRANGPATCLRICYCTRCPQYAEQHRHALALCDAEYAARVRTEYDRAERQAKRQAAERRSAA